MLFTAVAILNGGRWILPAMAMVAPSPLIFLVIQALQLLKPIMGDRAYQYVDEVIWSSFQRTVLCFFSNMNGTQVAFSGDYESFVRSKGNALVISNHQTNVDWICMDMLTLQPQVMGRMRFVLKDALKYVPLFGLYFWQHGCINVGRYGKFQEDKTINQLNYLRKENIPVWLVIFPEGTRYNPDNKKTILRSQRFAQDNGFSVLRQTLTPRFRGTFLALQELRTHLDAVYDVTIAYASTRQPSPDGRGFVRRRAPGMTEFILSYSPKLHIHIRKIDLPSGSCHDPQTVANWLHQLYQGKDRALEQFIQTGQFEEGDVVYRSVNSWSQTLPYNLLFLCFTALVLRHGVGRKLYTGTVALGSLVGMGWMYFH